jgi:YfiH family protein
MPFNQSESIYYYTFENLGAAGVKHAVFTRHHGVSPPPWKSLNFGSLVGDDPTRVAENYRRAFNELKCRLENLYDAWQVHETNVAFVEKPRSSAPHQKADILLTDRSKITLFMRFADCVPILLYDPCKRVIGLAHAGWLGTVRRVAGVAVQAMVEHYGSNPAHIITALGPSIGPDAYEIGPEVVAMVQDTFGSSSDTIKRILHKSNDSNYLDLWTANKITLEQSGVREIEVAGICTASNINDWYSHRSEHGKTGRFGVLLTLSHDDL